MLRLTKILYQRNEIASLTVLSQVILRIYEYYSILIWKHLRLINIMHHCHLSRYFHISLLTRFINNKIKWVTCENLLIITVYCPLAFKLLNRFNWSNFSIKKWKIEFLIIASNTASEYFIFDFSICPKKCSITVDYFILTWYKT